MIYKDNKSVGYHKNTFTPNINTSLNKFISTNMNDHQDVYFRYVDSNNKIKNTLNYGKQIIRKNSPK
jgi:hypothetical protein